MNEIVIYETTDHQTSVEVKFEDDTVWLSQIQMAELFGRNRVAITQHIGNIFKEGELKKEMVCKEFLQTTQHGAIKGKSQSRAVKHYNLDVIISVGYRVKSMQGTQFRQWATKRLKDYLIQGYAFNEQRLKQKNKDIIHLKTGIRIITRAIEEKQTETDNEVLKIFAKGLELLDDYDHEGLDLQGVTKESINYPDYNDYMQLIKSMYSDFQSEISCMLFSTKIKSNGFDLWLNRVYDKHVTTMMIGSLCGIWRNS